MAATSTHLQVRRPTIHGTNNKARPEAYNTGTPAGRGDLRAPIKYIAMALLGYGAIPAAAISLKDQQACYTSKPQHAFRSLWLAAASITPGIAISGAHAGSS